MVREDILAGLRNAVERGYSLQQAVYSFVSAGYNQQEVQEAAQFVHASSVIAQGSIKPLPQSTMPNVPIRAVQPSRGFWSRNWKIFVLIGILGILVAFLVLTLLYKDQIISWFG